MIVVPQVPTEQAAPWLGLPDLCERRAKGWTVIDGQAEVLRTHGIGLQAVAAGR